MAADIAIIGAGPAGLASAKAALEYGLTPAVFEKSGGLGGLWNPASGAMWDTMTTNLSRYACGFSDFAWKDNADLFPNAAAVHTYLCDYADAFSLHPYIALKTPALSVRQDGTGWRIKSSRGDEYFPHLIVASGVFTRPHIPAVEGLQKYMGDILHSADYKTAAAFAGRDVVVVGNAFSGAEIASDLAGTAASVTNMVRTPPWILKRYYQLPADGRSYPIDLAFYSRAAQHQANLRTAAERNALSRDFFTAAFGNPADAHPALMPDYADAAPIFTAVAPTYLEKVKSGSIAIQRTAIKSSNGRNILFEDGSSTRADAVIFCTGFQTSLPFMDRTTLDRLSVDPKDRLQPLLLHKTVWPDASLPNLAFAGMYRGPFFPVMELQARWAAGVFSGHLPAPSNAERTEGIRHEAAIRAQNPRPQFPHSEYVTLADTLAAEAGVLPDIESEPETLWLGPLIPQHYRLQGHGAQPGPARAAISAVNERMAHGF